MTKTEIWRTAERNDNYEVSDRGRVRRAKEGKGSTAGRILRHYTNKSHRYVEVSLYKDGKKKSEKVAHLVTEAFIGPRPLGLEVNHKDGVKANNAITNLEYATRSENELHAYKTGLKSHVGERNPRAKLTEAKVIEILLALSEGETGVSLGRRYGVGPHAIINIKSGRSWQHVHA